MKMRVSRTALERNADVADLRADLIELSETPEDGVEAFEDGVEASEDGVDNSVMPTVKTPPRTRSTPVGGAGVRLVSAFAAVEGVPVSSALRARARSLAASSSFRPAELAAVIGADLGLALAVIRRGGRMAERDRRSVSIEAVVEVLGPEAVSEVISGVRVFDPLAVTDAAGLATQRTRSHALQVRDSAIEIADSIPGVDVGEVATVALMHDLGRIVVTALHPDYDPESEFAKTIPKQRLRRERARYGIDHALVGGLLARRWDLPPRIAFAIERHHQAEAGGLAEVVGLADQIAHHRAGDAISIDSALESAARLGVGDEALRHMLSAPRIEVPEEDPKQRTPCPLSERELDALRHLAEGKVYKQIAADMGVSVSTIRSHLHNVYGKLEVIDRAQAVLKARENGWL